MMMYCNAGIRCKEINKIDMWKIREVELANRIVVAPMAGISNQAFRTIVKEFGAGLVYAEMVSANALLYENKKTFTMLETEEMEHPLTMQVFGGEGEIMKEAAMLVEQHCDADIIDINFGCPAGKVNRANAGSKWMQRPLEAAEAVKLVVDHVKRPVTVKMRLGWDHHSINVLEMVKLVEQAGASAIAIHGRTRAQMYDGEADWSYIRKAKELVSIPVIGNGDVKTHLDAKRMLEETGCDAVMIGRGALGDPWLIKRAVEYVEHGIELPLPTPQEKFELCMEQARRLIAIRGEKIAMSQMRSHALWYVKGIPYNNQVKNVLSHLTSYAELENVFYHYGKALETEDFGWLQQ